MGSISTWLTGKDARVRCTGVVALAIIATGVSGGAAVAEVYYVSRDERDTTNRIVIATDGEDTSTRNSTGDWQHSRVTVSNGGCSSGGWAAVATQENNRECEQYGNGYEAGGYTTAVGLQGADAAANGGVAVSDTGYTGGLVAVSGTGPTCGTFVGVSATGGTFCSSWYAVSGTGSASSWSYCADGVCPFGGVAVSGTGTATAPHTAVAGGDAHGGVVAVSATGNSQGGVISIAPLGRAS